MSMHNVSGMGWEQRMDGWYCKPGYGWIKRWASHRWHLYLDKFFSRRKANPTNGIGPFKTLTEAVQHQRDVLDVRAKYEIVYAMHQIVIRDLDGERSVTNDAEAVVADVCARYGGSRRIFYYDSAGEPGELVHNAKGGFMGFANVGVPIE